jgi:1-deoxy-D-xylulose-5-phosphate reductoisomerase
MKNILLLGATGSIGDSVLNVIRQNDSTLNLFGIAVGKNIKKTDGIIKEFLPKYVFVDDVIAYDDISSSNPDKNILNSDQELLNLISDDKVDIVISAIVGFAGLKASLMAVNAGKTVLIANKESIVAAGDILMPLARSKGSTIIPIDSEHNAIFQCLPEDKTTQDVDKIIITASGGPFIDIPLSKLSNISPQDALKHPNWQMGSKISIDSATLVNKCLELIEARYLFDLNEKFFDLVVHPQSIIHSIVRYKAG